jgi:hypothetical protein
MGNIHFNTGCYKKSFATLKEYFLVCGELHFAVLAGSK